MNGNWDPLFRVGGSVLHKFHINIRKDTKARDDEQDTPSSRGGGVFADQFLEKGFTTLPGRDRKTMIMIRLRAHMPKIPPMMI